ncbi:hypothetical protein AVEN_166893-1 [Araneus ventricosus]|uniref:Uncharacterized protein n=1 Tax=Araneus ventricosus TaxID=182803 RepID=A0A4Y2K6U6_ARAVE|nr:hypothetical protein AVEN_166893-1 [Araneus ventricosus]
MHARHFVLAFVISNLRKFPTNYLVTYCQINVHVDGLNPLTPSGPQNLTTFVYGGFVDIRIREMDSSAFSLFLLAVGGGKRTEAWPRGREWGH